MVRLSVLFKRSPAISGTADDFFPILLVYWRRLNVSFNEFIAIRVGSTGIRMKSDIISPRCDIRFLLSIFAGKSINTKSNSFSNPPFNVFDKLEQRASPQLFSNLIKQTREFIAFGMHEILKTHLDEISHDKRSAFLSLRRNVVELGEVAELAILDFIKQEAISDLVEEDTESKERRKITKDYFADLNAMTPSLYKKKSSKKKTPKKSKKKKK